MPKRALFLVLAVLIRGSISPAAGQETLEEHLLEEQKDSSEQSELVELLAALRRNPIDLNTATREQLRSIPGLPPSLREEIVRYRQENGRFGSKEDLRALPGMDAETFEYLSSIVTVEPTEPAAPHHSALAWRTRISNRIDKPVGFEDGTYESSAAKLYNRFRFALLDRFAGGVLLEKDSGENRLDDLRLFYLTMTVTDRLTLLVGNYQLQFGQGLVFWGPYGFSKSSDAIYPIRKRGRGARGYLTVDENAALLGASATFRADRFELSSFVSQNGLDATLISKDGVSSLFTSGFHRNDNEKRKKDVVQETLVGGRFQYLSPRGLTVGATFYHTSFDKRFQDPDLVRNRFKFRGQDNHVMGLDWTYASGLLELFGEFARSKSAGTAFLAGTRLDWPTVQLAVLYRDYQRDFQNFHGFGFGERNGTTQNEKGFYTGLQVRPTRTTIIDAYYDTYAFPWRTFFEPLPVQGNGFLAQVEQKLGSRLGVVLRYREKSRQLTQKFKDPLDREIRSFVARRQRQLRLQLDYRFSKELRLRGRVEFLQTLYDGFGRDLSVQNETGMLIYQDVRFRPTPHLDLAARITFFDTDSFDSRVFQYENDLPGVVTNRALYGRGTRWYAMLAYRPLRKSALYVKYSELFRDGVEVIGSGADRIMGNRDRRWGLQVELTL